MYSAEDIKSIRGALGITQLELANRLGVSLKTITNYETGGVIPLSKQKLIAELDKTINRPFTDTTGRVTNDAEEQTVMMSREVFDQITRLTETVLSQQRTIERLADLQKGVVEGVKGVAPKEALG